MTERVISFSQRDLASPEDIQRRMAAGPHVVNERRGRIRARLEPHMSAFNREIAALLNARRPLDYKIPAFWEIVDEIAAFNGDDVACRKGCSHCCYTAVLLPHEEAGVIARRIDRTPARTKPHDNAATMAPGYDNPCPFLVNEECSIYDNRPTVCRTRFSLDVDALMCELTPPAFRQVPLMDDLSQHAVLLRLVYSVTGKRPNLGEIREFWPKQ